MLSNYTELTDWKLNETLPSDLHSIHNALIIRTVADNHKFHWPLLLDPNNQAEVWVKAITDSKNHIRLEELVVGKVIVILKTF